MKMGKETHDIRQRQAQLAASQIRDAAVLLRSAGRLLAAHNLETRKEWAILGEFYWDPDELESLIVFAPDDKSIQVPVDAEQ
jgi:hypothetical protein